MFKKILMAALVLASFTFAETFGVHAAGNMSTMYGDDADHASTGVGFNAGLAGKFAFKDLPIAISPEVLIDMRNSGSDQDDNYSMTEWALEIPVMVRFDILGLVFVEAGPSFNFNLATGWETKNLEKDYDGDELNTFEFGLGFGVGTGIIPMVDIDFRVNLGLTKIFADYETKLATVKAADQKSLQFALGVSFWIM